MEPSSIWFGRWYTRVSTVRVRDTVRLLPTTDLGLDAWSTFSVRLPVIPTRSSLVAYWRDRVTGGLVIRFRFHTYQPSWLSCGDSFGLC